MFDIESAMMNLIVFFYSDVLTVYIDKYYLLIVVIFDDIIKPGREITFLCTLTNSINTKYFVIYIVQGATVFSIGPNRGAAIDTLKNLWLRAVFMTL